jgi:para-nitrobenzyl esterase
VLGIGAQDLGRLAGLPIEAIVEASRIVFDEVPVRTPGRLAFAPIVDGDIVPDYPVTLARKGLTHPVPLIIGTNRNEAALFRWMKSPLMPITPETIKAMFAEIAAEQPSLQLPSEAELGSTYRGRGKVKGMGVAGDLGFRMPSIWFADGHRAVAPVYLYRFDFATPMLRVLRLHAAHATELPFVWGNLGVVPRDPMFALGGRKLGAAVSQRVRSRWTNFARHGDPQGLDGEPSWRPYGAEDRATLIIDKQDSVVDDLDAEVRRAWGDDVLSFL